MIRLHNYPLISLDLETGGLTPGVHTPLAIGAVVVPHGDYNSTDTHEVTEENSFYVQLEWDTITVDPQALRVNKLNIANPPGPDGVIADRSFPAEEGLRLFRGWLADRHTNFYNTPIHTLGMNVGSFDLPMLKSMWGGPFDDVAWKWPFHYRSIDLNSLFLTLARIHDEEYVEVKTRISNIAWERNHFHKNMEHNALADAWYNVYAWQECMHRFEGHY